MSSKKEIRIWDFFDHKEEAPELYATADMLNQDEVEFTVEHLYINKNSKCAALYILATCKNKFVLYTGRLEIKFSR